MLRIKIRALFLAAVLFMLPVLALPARAEEMSYQGDNGNQAVVRDDADLFTDSEEKQLLERLKSVLDYGGGAIVTISRNSTTAKSYAEKAYREYFGYDSGTLFLMDMDNRYLQFFSDGSNYKVLTDSKTNEISDNVYSYASEGNYFKCADKAFEQVATVLSGGRIVTPMRYVTNAIFAVGLVLMVNIWIVVLQRKKPDPSKMVNTMGLYQRGVVKNVRTRMTNQRRTRHTESHAGIGIGGGGGGGFGGGGHSGGGGGHSF
ncbi:MAG: TPM domain-containing protein [Lachnospiraceae bacterium]|nr:TPM domain-containing protein [Lachnospiraceae bacterium]